MGSFKKITQDDFFLYKMRVVNSLKSYPHVSSESVDFERQMDVRFLSSVYVIYNCIYPVVVYLLCQSVVYYTHYNARCLCTMKNTLLYIYIQVEIQFGQ